MDPYIDEPVKIPSPQSSESTVQHFKEFSSGAGSTIFKANSEGVFAGGNNFTDAPWALSYTGVQYIGASGEIKIDGPNKKITVGAGDEVVLDGATGTITTNYLKDATYGLNGVFVYTTHKTFTSGNWTTTTDVPDSGGLLNVTLNYLDSNGYYKLLPGFNVATSTPYYYIKKGNGKYQIYTYAGNIYADVAHTDLYYSLFFNSLETAGW